MYVMARCILVCVGVCGTHVDALPRVCWRVYVGMCVGVCVFWRVWFVGVCGVLARVGVLKCVCWRVCVGVCVGLCVDV